MLLNDSPHTFKTLYGRVITVNASDGKREVIIVISITSPGSGYVLETTTKPNRFSLHSRERFPLTHRVPLLKMTIEMKKIGTVITMIINFLIRGESFNTFNIYIYLIEYIM